MTDLDAVIAEWRKEADSICEQKAGQLWAHDKERINTLRECADRIEETLSRLSQPMSSEPVGEVTETLMVMRETFFICKGPELPLGTKVYTTPPLPAIPEGFLILPDDLWSHRNDWKSACQIACDSAKTTDDRMYWLHQIGTLAKIEVLATETAPVPAIPAAPAPSVVVTDEMVGRACVAYSQHPSGKQLQRKSFHESAMCAALTAALGKQGEG